MPCAAAPAAAQPAPAPGYVLSDQAALTVEHTTTSAGTAARVAALHARAAAAVERRLGLPVPPRPHVIVAASDAEFLRRLERLGAARPHAGNTLAVAFPGLGVIVIRQERIAEGTDAGLEGTYAHELAHLALGELERRRGRRLSRWLNEGLAELASGRTPTAEEASALSGWARFGQMPDLAALREAFPDHGEASARTYTLAMAFLHWLDGRAGAPVLLHALEDPAVSEDEAFQRVLGMNVRDAELEWRLELADEHSVLRTLAYAVDVWGVIAVLALLAIARHVWVTRRLKRELALADQEEPR